MLPRFSTFLIALIVSISWHVWELEASAINRYNLFYSAPLRCTNPNGRAGVCVSIHQCASLDSVLRNRIERYYEFVRRSQCLPAVGNDDALVGSPTDYVCCTKEIHFADELRGRKRQHKITYPSDDDDAANRSSSSSPTTPFSWSTSSSPYSSSSSSTAKDTLGLDHAEQRGIEDDVYTKSFRYQDRFPRPPDCGGITIGNKIFGGVETELSEFSWMVLLEYRTIKQALVSTCAGSLITELYVLTAAHCVQGPILEHVGHVESVLLGEHNTATDIDCTGARCTAPTQRVRVASITVHEGYRDGTERMMHQHNDIALLRLARRVEFSDSIQPACLPWREPRQVLQSGLKLTVAGWGHNGSVTHTAEKRKVVVPMVEPAECRRIFAEKIYVADEQLCAGGNYYEDSCRGDSGGPLMRLSPEPAWIMEGIVSFGSGCGLERPAIYTRIRSYLDWIARNVLQ